MFEHVKKIITRRIITTINNENISVELDTLCIHGENDVFFPEEHTRFISDSLVRGEYSLIRNCGHEIHKDNPDEFLDKTCIFFSKVLARDCCVD